MKHLLWTLLVVSLPGATLAGPVPEPPAWALEQNEPNPFCPQTQPATAIRFAVETAGHVTLRVFDATQTTLVRWLVDAELSAGLFIVQWDGRDNLGALVPDGLYPYRMIATPPFGGPLVFQDVRTATVGCVVGVESRTWGAVKALFAPQLARD